MQDEALTDALYHLSFALQNRLSQLAAAHGLSLTQMRLLGILRDHEPTMQQLAQHMELEKSSLSGLVDRAEERGYVKRFSSDEDKRQTRVRITAKGRKLTQRVAGQIVQEMKDVAQDLGDERKAMLTQMADFLIAKMALKRGGAKI